MAGLPHIKEKLTLLHPAANYITLKETLMGFEELSIESKEWSDGRKDFFRHGLSTIPGRQNSPEVIPSTFEHSQSIRGRNPSSGTTRGRSLGMGRPRGG
jgi:hypothetical protein